VDYQQQMTNEMMKNQEDPWVYRRYQEKIGRTLGLPCPQCRIRGVSTYLKSRAELRDHLRGHTRRQQFFQER